MIYVLAYPEFEPNSARQINHFRSRHEPERAKLVPPHVTLVFGLKDRNPRDILTLCERVVENARRLTIEFTSSELAYDPFEHRHKLLLLCGKGGDALISLHNQIYDGLHRIELKPGIGYRPHMTVATHVDRAIIERLEVVEVGTFPISATINSLEMVELAHGNLNNLASIPFGGSVPYTNHN